jgi:hypothetical protein
MALPSLSLPKAGLFMFGLLCSLSDMEHCRAAEAKSFQIAAPSGYGVEDCLGENGECGKAVADAWCESLGRGSALTFGRSEDGPTVSTETVIPKRYFVTCGD